jgi:ferric-dicitrate binding protein FerR (iron transport regulator)/predicted negative regulator of RcsB-dependent stress response
VTPQYRWPDGPDEVSAELRRALDEAALRGPDDMTLRRGWSAVAVPMLPPRTRRGFWFAGGVATATALVLAGSLWLWPRATNLASNGHLKAPARSESPIAPGARRLMLEGGVEAVLGRSSVMRLEDGAPRIEVGEVRFSVPHRQPGHPFVVRAEGYRVVVVGTRFGINVDGKSDSKTDGSKTDGPKAVGVDVDEGIVEVWDAATQRRLARLTPGDSWQSPDVAAEAPTAVEPAPAPSPPAPTISTSSRALRHAGNRPAAARTLALASPGETATPTERATSPAQAPTAESAAARAALASGDAPRALQLLRALAQGTGPSAENASYEIGKVLNEKLGQPANAVAAWRHYRSTNPDGILRAEADVSIIETLARTGDTDEALSEANDFLRRRPDSERRAEIARLAGDLYRARGDCRHALAAYQITLGASRPRDAVEAATFHRAACLVQLGDAGGADAARAYLRAYPSGKFRGEATALVSGGGSAPRP